MLGGRPALPGLAWHDDPGLACSAVLLVGPVSAGELAAATDAMPDPGAPVADFAGNGGTRRDFAAEVLDAGTLAAARQHLAPIARRLADLPFRAAREERAEMTVLRLAHSRDSAIEARFAPGSPGVISYPLLGDAAPRRAELEGLALLDLLRRRHFIRAHACDRCASQRLLAFEACHACGGSDLADEAIVHHYRCGCQEPETSFIQGNQLVCPKCRRGLRHFGMDYGKPGTVVHCRGCGASSPEPDPRFACTDCAAVIPGQQATATDWFHYDLTDAGVQALRDGGLPGRAFRAGNAPGSAPGSAQDHAPEGARPLREFQLLATAALRSARKFARPFTLAQLTPADLAALRDRHGAGRVEGALHLAAAAVAAALSPSEFVAAARGAVLVGLPETDIAGAAAAMARVRGAASMLDLPLEFDVALLEGDAAAELLGRL